MLFGFLILKKRYTLSQIVEYGLAVKKNCWGVLNNLSSLDSYAWP